MKTYEDIAVFYDVQLCTTCDRFDYDHDRGRVVGRTIHWRSRRLSRPGLYRFLHFVARIRVMDWSKMNAAMRIYSEHVWIYEASRKLHVRFPRRYLASERARVRWLESKGMTITSQARLWAHRKEDHA